MKPRHAQRLSTPGLVARHRPSSSTRARMPAYDRAFYEQARQGMTKVSETIDSPAARGADVRGAGRPLLPASSASGASGRRPESVAFERPVGAVLQRARRGRCTVPMSAPATGCGAACRICPMATITADTLDWYGWDADGGGIHDVIGTRCDPTPSSCWRDRVPSLLPFQPDPGPGGQPGPRPRRVPSRTSTTC